MTQRRRFPTCVSARNRPTHRTGLRTWTWHTRDGAMDWHDIKYMERMAAWPIVGADRRPPLHAPSLPRPHGRVSYAGVAARRDAPPPFALLPTVRCRPPRRAPNNELRLRARSVRLVSRSRASGGRRACRAGRTDACAPRRASTATAMSISIGRSHRRRAPLKRARGRPARWAERVAGSGEGWMGTRLARGTRPRAREPSLTLRLLPSLPRRKRAP